MFITNKEFKCFGTALKKQLELNPELSEDLVFKIYSETTSCLNPLNIWLSSDFKKIADDLSNLLDPVKLNQVYDELSKSLKFKNYQHLKTKLLNVRKSYDIFDQNPIQAIVNAKIRDELKSQPYDFEFPTTKIPTESCLPERLGLSEEDIFKGEVRVPNELNDFSLIRDSLFVNEIVRSTILMLCRFHYLDNYNERWLSIPIEYFLFFGFGETSIEVRETLKHCLELINSIKIKVRSHDIVPFKIINPQNQWKSHVSFMMHPEVKVLMLRSSIGAKGNIQSFTT